ncbi:hypothetical protein DL98DRAFT_583797 [Cadophora sp. DSE1049]|nr:hypothetical protein DL98DRAFT_583797 [Cadophora sp. DSE1049]
MSSSNKAETIPSKTIQQLSPAISLYRPSNPTTKTRSSTSPSPDLIILAPWLSAQPRHITKYTYAYQSLFPHASILVIRTTVADMVYRPYISQQGDLKMILPLLQTNTEDQEPEILLHMFSNAGAHKASQLARAYQAQTHTVLSAG